MSIMNHIYLKEQIKMIDKKSLRPHFNQKVNLSINIKGYAGYRRWCKRLKHRFAEIVPHHHMGPQSIGTSISHN